MDWGSLAGIILALAGIVAGQVIEGGHIGSLFQPASFLIVAMGTLGAVLTQAGVASFMRAVKMLDLVFKPPRDDHLRISRNFVQWADLARREGIPSLERFCDTEPDLFVRKGLNLIVLGADENKVRSTLEQDINVFERRERAAVKVWEAAGGYAPTIGILGAVLGLIQVMENLDDPSRLGAGIAIAFVATVYGVALANLFFLPVGGRLKTIVQTEVSRREMLTDAMTAMMNGENSRMMQDRMNEWVV